MSRSTAVPREAADSLLDRFEAGAADFFWVPDHIGVEARADIAYAYAPDDSSDAIFNAVTWVRAADRAHADALVDEVIARQGAARGRWSLGTPDARRWLVDALEARGYGRTEDHDVLVVDTRAMPAALETADADRFRVERVTERDALLDLYAVTDASFARRSHARSDARVGLELAACSAAASRVVRFVAYAEDGTPAAAGGLNLDPTFGVGFLWAGGTHPDHRGRGAYTALVAARARWARSRSVEHIGVFAKVETSAPILRRLGFESIGEVAFWAP